MDSTSTYVFQSVQVLIALATNIALVWLLLLHTKSARIWRRSLWVDDRESSITVLVQLLSLMTMGLMVSEAN